MTVNYIELLGLEPLPDEGGYFRRTYTAEPEITMNGETRKIGSAIYYYLASDDFSAWHRVQCDEMWHFYAGSNLTIHLLTENKKLTSVCLGDITNASHAVAQYTIPANTWVAAEVDSDNTFSLIGCTCFPAFEFRYFELADREKLTAEFPAHKDIIHRLTRG